MKTKHILCLESDEGDAALIAKNLLSMPTRPEMERVGSGDEYRERIATNRYDLILADCSVSGFSGIEALSIARNLAPDTPFIFFTSEVEGDSAVDTMLNRATDYVFKQRPKRLISAITRALECADLRRQQRSDQESLRFQAEILKSISDGVVATDSAGRVVFWNPAAELIFQRAAQTVMMERLQCLSLDVVPGTFARLMQDVVRNGLATGTVECQGPSATHPVLVSIVANRMTDCSGAALGYLLIINVAAERNHEAEVEAGSDDEAEGSRSKVVDVVDEATKELQRFGYSLGHDLSGPLRAVAGYARILAEDFDTQLGEEGLCVVSRISSAATRMDRIIKGMVQLATLSGVELNVGNVDLASLARSVAGELAESNPTRSVKLVVQPNLHANADARLLRCLFEEVMGNAWKFTAKQAAPTVSVGFESTNRGQAYFVRDNGIGFDPEHADQIFEPFRRLHRADEYPGVGVGLAAAERIARRHGGEMWASSRPNEGATFYFTLGPTQHA